MRGADVQDASPATSSAAPFEAAIFDMDGLLVDSEPLWHDAEVEILGALGVPIAPTDCRRTKGMFVREVTRYWHERHPWRGPTTDEVAVAIVDRVIQLVSERATLKPGVPAAIDLCRRHALAVAVASSSEHRLIEAVLDRFGLSSEFAFAHSAEEEPYGKPHPAVLLTAAARLGVAPDRCIVWEDAAAGVIAAKAARMACVAVPEPFEREQAAFALADAVLGTLEEADERLWARLVAARTQGPPLGVAGGATTGAEGGSPDGMPARRR